MRISFCISLGLLCILCFTLPSFSQIRQQTIYIDDGLGNFLQLKFNGGGNPATLTLPAPGLGGALSSDASGTVSIGTLSIANGGTGSGTATGALTNLLPAQTGNGGNFLKTDGLGTISWASASTSGIIMLTRNSGSNLSTGQFLGDGAEFASAAAAQILITRAGTLQHFYVHLSTTATSTFILTVYVNGVSTSLSASVTVGNQLGADLTDQIAVSAGDVVSVRAVIVGTPGAIGAASLELAN